MDTQIKSEPTANQILDRVVTLQGQMTTLQGQVTTLQGQMTTLQGQVTVFGERLHVVEIDVAVIKSNYATREDFAKLEARLIRWFVGTAITLSAVVGTIAFSAAKFIH